MNYLFITTLSLFILAACYSVSISGISGQQAAASASSASGVKSLSIKDELIPLNK